LREEEIAELFRRLQDFFRVYSAEKDRAFPEIIITSILLIKCFDVLQKSSPTQSESMHYDHGHQAPQFH